MSSQNDPSNKPDASDPKQTFNLQSLAPEVVSNIINQVDKNDTLKSLRLVNKSLDEHARRKMFEQVILAPDENAIARFEGIANNETLSLIPRHALIQTREDLDEHEQDGDPIDEMDDFWDALTLLAKFPRLNSLHVAFTKNCVGTENEDSMYIEANEPIAHRVQMLEWIFQAIKDRMNVEGASRIRSLTLQNLQNAPIDAFTGSELFSTVMQQLDELHIGLIQEYNEHGPDHDYTCIELQTFPAHLCSKWLKPVAPNLRALSLYSATENWGCFPGYFDPSGISFPKLETLSLGYYTIAHDDQLDWILAQHKSLTKLVLHNCMIASLIRIDKTNMAQWKPSTHDWEKLPPRTHDWADEFRYRGTWSYFFDKIAEGLPNLKEFCFRQVDVHPRWGSEEKEYGVGNRLEHGGAVVFPERYIAFNNGILPTHWPEAEKSGELRDYLDGDDESEDPNFHKEFLEGDRRSLERLVEICRGRREGGARGEL